MPLGAGDAIVYTGYARRNEASERDGVQMVHDTVLMILCMETKLSKSADRTESSTLTGQRGFQPMGGSILPLSRPPKSHFDE